MGKRIVFFDGSTGNSKYLKTDDNKISPDFFENPNKDESSRPDNLQDTLKTKLMLIRKKLYMLEKSSGNKAFPLNELIDYITQFDRNLDTLQQHISHSAYYTQSLDYNVHILEYEQAEWEREQQEQEERERQEREEQEEWERKQLERQEQEERERQEQEEWEREQLERQRQEEWEREQRECREREERERQEREEQEEWEREQRERREREEQEEWERIQRERQEQEEQEEWERKQHEQQEQEEREREAEFWHMMSDTHDSLGNDAVAQMCDTMASFYED